MAEDYSMLTDPSMKEIFESFIIETREIFDNLDVDLVELENQPTNKDLLNQIFRAFHTVKGTSGFLGLEKMMSVTHKCEDLLNKLRKDEIALNDKIMNAILAGFDAMKGLLRVTETEFNEDYDISLAQGLLESVLSGNIDTVDEATLSDDNISLPDIEIEESNVEEQESENGEEETGSVVVVPIPELPIKETKTEKVEKKVVSVKQTQDDTGPKRVDNTIRVDVQRLDNLVNIVSELVLGRNRLTQINHDTSTLYEGSKVAKDLSEVTRQIDLMTTELQLAVMKTRMIKIGKVFNKFPRLVRDLSKDAGKDIELVIKGEETELDKTLIEEINDPLVHLIRNSVDHGIEKPADREKKGKPAKGTVTLSAEHEGNNIIITIEDDGKGMDPDMIKEKAISKGLISAERASELSKQEVFNLIFIPGFSTAEKVTNISGRGVGMDVVKTNVTKLRGIINIDSVMNVGTKIIIKLPLTLAIIQGLLVNIKDETVVIPLNLVYEVIKVTKGQIYSIKKKEVIKLRDSVIPLINVGGILYSHDRENNEWQYIVVVGIAEKVFGIKVDSLLGQKEVVIKSLGQYLGNVDGIAGSTIMGDGKVVVILDLAEIIHKIKE